MHETTSRTWFSGKTWRERVVREVGGGIGMGKTCGPKAFSFQCMTKFTTNKRKKKRKKAIDLYIVTLYLATLYLVTLVSNCLLVSGRFFFLSFILDFYIHDHVDYKQRSFHFYHPNFYTFIFLPLLR